MRIATFNVENLFERAAALNLPTFEDGRRTLELHAEINTILNRDQYSPTDKVRIVESLVELGLAKSDTGTGFAELLQLREKLIVRRRVPAGQPPRLDVVAKGRADWVGWVELKKEPVSEKATAHTAMVLRDVNPDILGVVEVEGRLTLAKFSNQAIKDVGGTPFGQVMAIDGNDDRGIDVGIAVRPGYTIREIRSHVYHRDAIGIVFSRDCPEYVVTTPTGRQLVVLVNHFKSQGFGSQAANNRKRERQSKAVAEIYRGLLGQGVEHVAVVGDLNGAPNTQPLRPLVAETTLKDISSHPRFTNDGFAGTFGDARAADKLDYVLLSPALFDMVTGGGAFRRGVWAGTGGQKFRPYETMSGPQDAASDHAALFADIDF
jgi:endonuclease/exonuclease/phosphatase family metal-dependent hydrolase